MSKLLRHLLCCLDALVEFALVSVHSQQNLSHFSSGGFDAYWGVHSVVAERRTELWSSVE